jgi:hypothetical protein
MVKVNLIRIILQTLIDCLKNENYKVFHQCYDKDSYMYLHYGYVNVYLKHCKIAIQIRYSDYIDDENFERLYIIIDKINRNGKCGRINHIDIALKEISNPNFDIDEINKKVIKEIEKLNK